MTGYSQEHVTAAVAHTLHFLRLLTFYLGVKLPFEIIWSGGAPCMGMPFIVAGRGPERGGWSKSVVLCQSLPFRDTYTCILFATAQQNPTPYGCPIQIPFHHHRLTEQARLPSRQICSRKNLRWKTSPLGSVCSTTTSPTSHILKD